MFSHLIHDSETLFGHLIHDAHLTFYYYGIVFGIIMVVIGVMQLLVSCKLNNNVNANTVINDAKIKNAKFIIVFGFCFSLLMFLICSF